MMIILERFVLYVTGLDLAQYEIEIPSSDPEVSKHTNVDIGTGDMLPSNIVSIIW